MNNKDEIVRLEKYAQSIKDRMEGPIPPKHVNHPVEFKQYLSREYLNTVSKIERLKLLDK